MNEFIKNLDPYSTFFGFVAGVSTVLMITMVVIIIGCVRDRNRGRNRQRCMKQ